MKKNDFRPESIALGTRKHLWVIEQYLGRGPKDCGRSPHLYSCRDIFGTVRIFPHPTLIRKNFGVRLWDECSHKLDQKLRAVRNNMLRRCYDSKCYCFNRYGLRGIKVCQEWLGEEGYNNFRKWALSKKWSPDLTIDRINVDGDYIPSNCRLISRSENCRYTSRTRLSIEAVSEIRSYFLSTENTADCCNIYSKKFGVSLKAIRDVINGRTWN